MTHTLTRATSLALALLVPAVLSAGQASAPPRIAACGVLSKAEVKKHLPWQNVLDQFPPEEEPIGAAGSGCTYPTVHVQILPYTAGFVSAFQKSGGQESIAGLGDEAWFRNNRNMFAEVLVKVGPRILTLQADADDGVAGVKPGVIALARAYVAKLR